MNDIVQIFGKRGFISGFTKCAVYVKDFHNKYIALPNKTHNQINVKELKLINHANNWQYIIQLKS